MLDDICLFVQIVRAQGLSAAAEKTNLPPATVTRRLQKLEQNLGSRLIHRSARKFSLTAEGEAYYAAYADLVAQFEDTSRSLSEEVHQLGGRLTVLAPTNASVGILQPMWSQFLRIYPQIRLDLRLSNETKDILDGQVDIALRVGPQPDSSLTQMRLGTVATVLVAAPGYLDEAGVPESLADLETLRTIAATALPVWTMSEQETGAKAVLRPQPSVFVDDIGMARQLARDGHGVSLLPVSEVADDLRSGALHRVLRNWRGQERIFYAVWPSGRLLNARAKCLRDFAQRFVAGEPILQGAIPGRA
ncbi:LysR family transcriptional regulator [Roseibium sp.]|uniref:LysR family transcriptional regulator n=1 Tax=Roseibium sp. TaxID=1936156 RepID=UPI003A96B38D